MEKQELVPRITMTLVEEKRLMDQGYSKEEAGLIAWTDARPEIRSKEEHEQAKALNERGPKNKPILMTKQELHEFGINIVGPYIIKDGLRFEV